MKHSFSDKDGLTEINMVPLIDIMLVLVVILLMTASFVVPNMASEGIHVSLPQAQGAQSVAESPVQVELDASGGLWGDGRSVSADALSTVLADMSRERPVLIAADRDVRLQSFVSLMDALKQQVFSKISVRTQK